MTFRLLRIFKNRLGYQVTLMYRDPFRPAREQEATFQHQGRVLLVALWQVYARAYLWRRRAKKP